MHGDKCSSLRNVSRPEQIRFSMPSICSRRCQLLYSDNGKTFVGASEELKKTVKALNKDRIYKALAVANTTWKFNLRTALIVAVSGSF